MLAQYGKVFHYHSQCDISNAVHLGIQCISQTHYFILDEIWHTSIFVHLPPLKIIVAMKQRLPLWCNTKKKDILMYANGRTYSNRIREIMRQKPKAFKMHLFE